MTTENDAWFRVEKTGYAAAPTDRRGWIAIAVFFAVQLVFALTMLPGSFGMWIFLCLAMTVGFVWLCMSKTVGEWAWKRSK